MELEPMEISPAPAQEDKANRDQAKDAPKIEGNQISVAPPTEDDLELGSLHKMLKKAFGCCSGTEGYATVVTILISLFLSLSDGLTDVGLASMLHGRGLVTEAILVLVTDYATCAVSLGHHIVLSLGTDVGLTKICLLYTSPSPRD